MFCYYSEYFMIGKDDVNVFKIYLDIINVLKIFKAFLFLSWCKYFFNLVKRVKVK